MDRNWNDIIDDLGPRLFRYFRARYSREESADLTQETLIRLVQKSNQGQFDPRRGNIRMFAYGIAHYVALESAKSTKAAPPHLELINQESIEQKFIDRQNHEQMRRALASLPPTQVQIISLMIDEELSLKDIGVLLDIPLGTVKSHIHRAKESLREILASKECL